MNQYQILIHQQTLQKAQSYQQTLGAGRVKAGAYLQNCLPGKAITDLSSEEFLERLVNTKRPQIFAESAVYGDGSDWNQSELSILGDISIAVPVNVYDNGLHEDPEVFSTPFPATLLYVPGALLQNGCGHTPADWGEVVTATGEIDPDAYAALYERRLLPLFLYAHQLAQAREKQALITIPGLGCGQFAGKFRGQLGDELKQALIRLLQKYSADLASIKAVYYDPYRECANERLEIDQISFMLRPLTHSSQHKPQLCPPQHYAEAGDNFSDCELFSLVAWDHVSWPGNDFYIGSRATDDGVKAAATDSMAAMTGVEGAYHEQNNSYDPPAPYRNWLDVVEKNNLKITVKNNLQVF